MPWFAWVAVGGWIAGWLVWFLAQDNDWTSEVLFNMSFGFALWPIIAVAQVISGDLL